ncbi:MAG: hypothetical protein SVV80_07350 [Planctomycetota bacterium]|nr:hypothetical protein [Planctomycetota bacterium]
MNVSEKNPGPDRLANIARPYVEKFCHDIRSPLTGRQLHEFETTIKEP